MKSLLLVLTAVSFSTFACPDLTGIYTKCDTDSRRDVPEGLSVSVSMTNANSYLITYESDEDKTTQEVIADGIEREGSVTSSRFGTVDFTVKASCKGEELTVAGTSRVLGLPVRETSRMKLDGERLLVERLKFGRVIESFHCQ